MFIRLSVELSGNDNALQYVPFTSVRTVNLPGRPLALVARYSLGTIIVPGIS